MSIHVEPNSMQDNAREYALGMRRDLQGMRAFAVLSVFIDHLFGWPAGGFVGVDVFFVLSGFFITGLLIGERTRSGGISFRNFYARRCRRILPSAVLVIVTTVGASFLLLTPSRASSALTDGLWASVFLSNFRFERVGTDYFAQGQPDSPLLHYWSLSIEEQFYFVWPILLLLLFAATRRYSRPGRRYPVERQIALALFMSALVASSFVWACIRFYTSPTGAYFSTATRVWELGVGALLAIISPALRSLPRSLRPCISYIGFAGAVASLFAINPELPFPGPWAALPVVSTALVIAAFIGSDVRRVPHLTNPWAQYVGEVSYTMYLWHWPAIVLLAVVTPRTSWLYYVTCIAVTVLLTVATYHLYENPIRRSNWLDEDATKLKSSRLWSGIGAVSTAIVLLSAIGVEAADSRSENNQQNQRLQVTATAPEFGESPRCFGAAAITTPGCLLYDRAEPLYPGIDRFENDGEGAYECYREQGQPFESCTYGYEGPDAKRIAVVGNSHAAMLLPSLSQHLIENKWSMTTFVGYACAWVVREGRECSAMMSETQQRLLSDSFDLVVVSGSRQHGSAWQVPEYVEAWSPIAKKGIPILVIADVPSVSPETIECVTRITGDPGRCATPRATALATPDYLLSAAPQVPGAIVLDLTDSFCVGDVCPAIIGNVIVYMDSAAHVTATYMRTLSPQIVAAVQNLLR